jgi:hypothetical protein
MTTHIIFKLESLSAAFPYVGGRTRTILHTAELTPLTRLFPFGLWILRSLLIADPPCFPSCCSDLFFLA